MAQNSSDEVSEQEGEEEEIIDAGDEPVRDEQGLGDDLDVEKSIEVESTQEDKPEESLKEQVIEVKKEESESFDSKPKSNADVKDEVQVQPERKPWLPLYAQPQADTDFSFRVKFLAGITASMSTYEKSIPFEYESVKMPAWGVEAQMRIGDFLLEGDVKSLPAKVYSNNGHLNLYGWRYRHLWGSMALGWLFDKTHHVYLKGMAHYAPTLFPTQVGVFHSEAAFEKIVLIGLGAGYKSDFLLWNMPMSMQLDLFYVDTLDTNYDIKYGVAWNARITRYHQWRNVRLGVSYDQVGQILSVNELYTGQDYPFRSLIRLHQILFHLEFPLL